jgi:hypothetical protein
MAVTSDPVTASAARPSIFEVRGDGLPRFARSDEPLSVMAVTNTPCHGRGGILSVTPKVCARNRDGFGKLAMHSLVSYA